MTVAGRQGGRVSGATLVPALVLLLALAPGAAQASDQASDQAPARASAQAPADTAATGPAKATLAGPAPARKSGGKSAAKRRAWDVRGAFSCAFIYNDNILSASPDDIDSFESGLYPYKYSHNSTDDLVVAPGLDLEARRELVSLGQSRFRFRVKRWMYANNPIKTNTDFDFYFRQYVGRRQSLEVYLHAAPWQYIRDLSDRSPLADPASPSQMEQFRFQRNIWNLAWRQVVSSRVGAMLVFERNFRYYNQPFIENDIATWELRGNVAWAASRVLTLSADYSFESADGRGYDMAGETATTSDDSDPSYDRDLYRVEAEIAWPALAKVIDGISLSFLYMDYYYTTQRPLVEDPYHVGRHDMYYKNSVEVQRRLTKQLSTRLAVRRTERIVESPWDGDLRTDKAFVQWLTWVELTYRF